MLCRGVFANLGEVMLSSMSLTSDGRDGFLWIGQALANVQNVDREPINAAKTRRRCRLVLT